MRWSIRDAQPSDVAGLARVLAGAFSTEPGMSFMLPDERTRKQRLERMFATSLSHLHIPLGATQVAFESDTAIAGAVWCPPEKWKAPWWRLALTVPGKLRALGRRVPAGQALKDGLEGQHPTEPHWYLAVLGTDPAFQGTGAGGALLRSGVARCDRSGLPAYVETADENNLPIYERYGFKVIHEIQIRGGAPRQWGLWRQSVPA